MAQYVFISYARKDAEFALKLGRDLREKGVPIWLDQLDIPPGQRWDRAVEQALESCDRLLIILSPDSAASENVLDEVAVAFEHKKPIVPVLYRPCKVPLRLVRLQYIDFTRADYQSALEHLRAAFSGLVDWRLQEAASRERKEAEREAQMVLPMPNVGAAGGLGVGVAVGRRGVSVAVGCTTTTRSVAVAVWPRGGGGKPSPTPTATERVVAAQPTTTVREKDGIVMVHVPGGTFQMSSTEGADEQLVHTVTLDGFWIDRTEVTNAQYARCVAAGKCGAPSQTSSGTRSSYYGDSQYDDYPVIYVSWNDATAYCAWAGGQLPTEAQWEYAAGGPDGRVYPWGNEFDGTRLNYCDVNCPFELADKTANDGYADTAPVGSYPGGASWVGALDMAGNVWEWVADRHGSYPSEPQANPTGPSSGEDRGLRGGGWLNDRGNARVAFRGWGEPGDRSDDLGFRCAMSAGK